MNPTFQESVNAICQRDPRYHRDAYTFLTEALDAVMKTMQKKKPGRNRHVTGQELAEGIREYALRQFGALSFTLLAQWGIHSTIDFGHIVYNLIDEGRLGKSADDSLEDFKEVFDFKEAFLKPFEPK